MDSTIDNTPVIEYLRELCRRKFRDDRQGVFKPSLQD